MAAAVVPILVGCWGGRATSSPLDVQKERCNYKLVEYSVSPDGKRLAGIMRAANAQGSGERVVIARIDRVNARWSSLYEGDSISSVRWLNDTKIAFVQNGRTGNLFTENIDTRRIRRAVATPEPIFDYAAAPGGEKILYAFGDERQEGDWVSRAVPDRLSVKAIALPAWATRSGLKNTSSQGRISFGVWPRGRQPIMYSTVLDTSELTWIGEKRHAIPAILRLTSERSVWARSLIDVSAQKTVISERRLDFISWVAASDTGALAIASPGLGAGRFESWWPIHLYVLSPRGHLTEVSAISALSIPRVWWMGQNLLADVDEADYPGGPDDSRLVEVDWKRDRVVKQIQWPNGSLDGCQVSQDRTTAVCEADELTKAGQLVKVELQSGRMTLLSSLSPCIRTLRITFRTIAVRNRYGRVSTGFLALPSGKTTAETGSKYGVPLAVMLYGFNRTFAKNGQWIHAYPVARLVSAGIAVLLLDFPETHPWSLGDTTAARREMLDVPLSTVEEAPRAVAASGVPLGRVMVMGWSWGGFIAAQAIEQSCRFVAAEVGDPANWNITAYALENSAWRDFENSLFGGPPDARYVSNYVAFDPMRSGDPPNGPIMLEFVSRNLDAGQYLEEWRAAGAYVAAFAYHYSSHSLSVPSEARISRDRNLLWAELNLLPNRRPNDATLSQVGLSLPPRSAYRCR